LRFTFAKRAVRFSLGGTPGDLNSFPKPAFIHTGAHGARIVCSDVDFIVHDFFRTLSRTAYLRPTEPRPRENNTCRLVFDRNPRLKFLGGFAPDSQLLHRIQSRLDKYDVYV
jgi:hypothetical protein